MENTRGFCYAKPMTNFRSGQKVTDIFTARIGKVMQVRVNEDGDLRSLLIEFPSLGKKGCDYEEYYTTPPSQWQKNVDRIQPMI